MEVYNTRFFTYDDESSNRVLLKIPNEWWSRLYEYHWAAQFADENDVCLDAACGVLHPYKFFLASKCRDVYGCDLGNLERNNVINEMRYYFDDNDINLAMNYFNNINLRNYNLIALGYEDNKFDKVYCISVLEHLNKTDIKKALNEIYRVLKDKGLFILTVDYPSIDLNDLIADIAEIGFKFKGSIKTEKPANAIYSPLFGGLNCFRILVEK